MFIWRSGPPLPSPVSSHASGAKPLNQDESMCYISYLVKDLNVNRLMFLSRSLRVLISVSALCCATLSLSYADDGSQAEESVTSAAPETPKATAPSATPSESVASSKRSTLEASTSPSQAPSGDLSPAELAKELRLEELRYKHLWIAYSIVWLVIFLFIRSTWKRSEAVAGRLDELKGRIKRLEGARSREES